MRSENKIDLRLITRKMLSLGLPALVLAVTASAAIVTTPAGSATSGPVSASATFITGNGFVNITLTDLQINPSNSSQLLSSLSFTLDSGATSGTLFMNTGTQVSVNSTGTPSMGSNGSVGWGLTNNGTGGMQLSAGGSTGLIIGLPSSGGTYSSAGSTIDGHSFVLQSVQFIIDISGVTSNTKITSATFGFGTTPGQFSVKGCLSTDSTCGQTTLSLVSQVPEPVTLLLTGSGLIGLFFLRRRRA